MKKRLFSGLLFAAMSLLSVAQVSLTLSPYSQFGLGTLSDQSVGFNSGMDGLAIGIRNGKIVNVLNPASYSAVDSLTMIFDVGVSGQITNFKEGGRSLNAKTANFDYATIGFRLLPKVGLSFGIIPFSNIGYNYYSAAYNDLNVSSTGSSYYNETHDGNGGFSQTFLGFGWEVLKGFSIGANFSYFWGEYTKNTVVSNSDTYVNTLTKSYSTSVNSYKIDFGLQFQTPVTSKDILTVGATIGLGHNIGGEAKMLMNNYDNTNALSYTTRDSIPDALEIPYIFGIGASVLHNQRLTLGVDYNFQKWSSINYPVQTSDITPEHKLGYKLQGGHYRDRHKVTIGAEWVPNPVGRKIMGHMRYRMGVSYATPYINVNGNKGPRELSVSAGFGIPLVNSWNNRSTLNISAQWVNTTADNFIRENSFRLNIGLTFNERWFAKWKVD